MAPATPLDSPKGEQPGDDDFKDPKEAFRQLRQAFDNVKSSYTDPWTWHEYLEEDVDSDTDETEALGIDPEVKALLPQARSHQERLKSHLLACGAELGRAAQAADKCYFHIALSPDKLRECILILGSSGEIDAEDLLNSGGTGPEALLGILQNKLEAAKHEMEELTTERDDLQEQLEFYMERSELYWTEWQNAAFTREESVLRLDAMTVDRDFHVERGLRLEKTCADLQQELFEAIEAKRQRTLKMLRDIFGMQQEHLMKEMFDFFKTQMEKERMERLAREREAQSHLVEGALRTELARVMQELPQRNQEVGVVVHEIGRLKLERKELAHRILQKYRPYERKEYLWNVFNAWLPFRNELRLEKLLEREETVRKTYEQLHHQTTGQAVLAAERVNELELDLVAERAERDTDRRNIVACGAARTAVLLERVQAHRDEELEMLDRLRNIDVEERDEKIAVLERDIAEDTHVKALKRMIVELEARLHAYQVKKAMHPQVVDPGTGPKCVGCSRETLFKSWVNVSPAMWINSYDGKRFSPDPSKDIDPDKFGVTDGGLSGASTTMGPATWKGREGWHKTASTTGMSWKSQFSEDWSPRKGMSTTRLTWKAKTGSEWRSASSVRTLSPLSQTHGGTVGKMMRPASHSSLPSSSRRRKKSPQRQDICGDQGPDELELGFRTSWRV
jgi:hypothetical protein